MGKPSGDGMVIKAEAFPTLKMTETERDLALNWVFRMMRGFTKAVCLMGAIFAAQSSFAAQTSGDDASKNGFFVGLQSGLISDSGLVPVVAGYQGSLDDLGRRSVTANGYYMYNMTEWSIGTYVGGGLGAFNISSDASTGLMSSSMDFGYQGMAGVTYQFSPAMTLGVEYRYLGSVEPWSQRSFDTVAPKDESQSVSLRFDFTF